MPKDPHQIREWSVYKITSPSDRIYIGKTQNLPHRIMQYKTGAHIKQHFINRCIRKYGFDNHKIEVIDKFSGNLNYANDKEMFWVRSYMSNVCKYPEMNGMNLTDGGDGVLGYKHTEKRKKEISEQMRGNKFNLGKKQSPELIEKRISKIRGVKYSEERLINQRERNIALRGVPIVVINLITSEEMEFRTINEAAKFLKIDRNTVSLNLRDKIKTMPCKKNRIYQFKYKKDAFSS
jgi:group I intron endonuclease